MMNFRNYVIGVGDRNYKVLGKRPAMTIQRDDLCPPELGWQWSIIRLNCGVVLPFCSYCGNRLVIQCGWQPFGYAEIKINWRKVAFVRMNRLGEDLISVPAASPAGTAGAATADSSGSRGIRS
jgi:hypothetical protein